MIAHAKGIDSRLGKAPWRPIIALMLAVVAAPPLAWSAEAVAPDLVTRKDWGARKPNAVLMTRQSPREIVIHHTSYRGRPKLSLERKLRGLESFSRRGGKVGSRAKPAWGDLPYHFYIGATGRIGEGRDPTYAGDTNTRYSVADRIQIVVEGHFDQERPRPEQLTALRQLLAWLVAKYKIAPTAITAHNDHVSTDCPGKHLKALLPDLRASLARPVQ